MSKAKNNIPRAAIHVGAPAKSFSAAEGYEPERRGWDENTYRLKNQDTNNHYDFSRNHLNFEINGEKLFLLVPIPCHFMSVYRNVLTSLTSNHTRTKIIL